MSAYPPLHGLTAAPYTAFHANGSLSLALIEKQAASLVANGVTGAFVCGTTGEGASMTTTERLQVAERWQAVAGSQLRVLVNVGHTSLAECREIAAHAQRIGAAGIGCFAPFFYKPANIEDLVAFCVEVAAAAPELPFYYYQIPSMTGVSLPVVEFLHAAVGRIPNLAGVKFTYENLMDFAACVRFDGGRLSVVFGRDEVLIAGLSVGARGAIGSTYNFLAPVFHDLMADFQKGDLEKARAKQAEANAVIDVLIRFGGLNAGKAAMKLIGIDCGPTRLPLRPLSEAREAEFKAEMERVGFFDLCSRG